MKLLPWVWFGVVQLSMLTAAAAGLVLLIPFCLAQAWKPATSRFDPARMIDAWSWGPLNWIYGNPEDGVSGAAAKIWLNGTTQGPYMPGAKPAWRAYSWSALRNSCDNLKYVFSWRNGPFAKFTLFGRTFQAGWQIENGFKVPVLS